LIFRTLSFGEGRVRLKLYHAKERQVNPPLFKYLRKITYYQKIE
jgi:hypothetical protein